MFLSILFLKLYIKCAGCVKQRTKILIFCKLKYFVYNIYLNFKVNNPKAKKIVSLPIVLKYF